MDGFMSRLDEINAVADESPGFVWRLQADDENATSIRVADPRDLINLTLWDSVETLSDFVYKSRHAELMRSRQEWFLAPEGSSLVLWWTPVGTRPTVEEAVRRLARLNRGGPSPLAFTFRRHWPAPAG